MPTEFWNRYAVLADKREHALAWVDPHLADLLMTCPEHAPDEQIPFLLVITRGKAYLRMHYTPADMPTLEHVWQIFTYACACESGVEGLKTDILI